MKKKHCIITQMILLLWFFLDMIGIYFGDKCLVTRSYKEDGIFFLIYLIAVVLFIIKEKFGKWFVICWMSIWFVIQFLCHEWYTLFGSGFMGNTEDKIAYFKDCIQVANVSGRYVPDLYHIVLHVFILTAFISIVIIPDKSKE